MYIQFSRASRAKWVILSLMVLAGTVTGVLSQTHPESIPEKLERAADQALRLLHSSVIDFYYPASMDTKYGGYLQDADVNGSFSTKDKFLTFQARQLWFFSHMAHHGIKKEEMLQAATMGYNFLIDHFMDTQHGGFYSRVSRDGFPLDPAKHAYLNAFTIFSLVEYFRASGDPSALEEALKLFWVLESESRDRENGGYHEFFTSSWVRITDPGFNSYVGPVNTKTYNTHLHLLEAFTELYKVSQDATVGNRLAELIFINTRTVKHPEFAANIDGWNNDWTVINNPKNFRASYGHDVECVWLVLEAARALGWPIHTLLSWARETCQYSIQYGYDPDHGGFYNGGPFGEISDDTRKVWWIQAEGLVAMLTLWELTGDEIYLNHFLQTFQFIEKHQLNAEGIWVASVQADGQPADSSTSNMWQAAYHSGRALWRIHQMIKSH